MQMVKTALERYPRSRLLMASGIVATIMICVFMLEKIFLPQSETGLSIPPLVDGVFFLGIGLSLSVAMAQYSYRAWSLDSRDFMEWYFCQSGGSANWLRKWYSHFPEGYLRFLYRFMGPFGFLAGMAMAGIGFMISVAPLFVAG